MSWDPVRGIRWDNCTDAIDEIEGTSCDLGCRRGISAAKARREGIGRGGSCLVILGIVMADKSVPEIDDVDGKLRCSAREPLPEPVPRARKPRPAPTGQLAIGDL